MIIAAYAGTGKTTMAKLYPETVIDFVCMPYKYMLDDEDTWNEARKANEDNIMQDDWPFNYVSAIKQAMDNDKILLIPSDFFVLMILQAEKIPYILCYPQKDAKEVYRKRYLDRGNIEELNLCICGTEGGYMSILFSGDFHDSSQGEISVVTKKSLIKKYGREKYNGINYHVILGDGGFMWPGNIKTELENYKKLARRPFPVLCVLGNHEPIYGIKDVPEVDIGIGEKVLLVNNKDPFIAYLKRGKIYTIDGFRFLVLGGAFSIDKVYRLADRTWWAEEYWLQSEKRDLFRLLESEHSFDGVLSHTGPDHINKMVMRYLSVFSGTSYIIRDEVALLNDRIDENIQCPQWWCGHWHRDLYHHNDEIKRGYQYLYRTTKILDKLDDKMVVYSEYGETGR
jgi:3-oxoacid CoA-transferase subunit A